MQILQENRENLTFSAKQLLFTASKTVWKAKLIAYEI